MVSLQPPVTSEIIFFISRWVFGTPNFSIIRFKPIMSAEETHIYSHHTNQQQSTTANRLLQLDKQIPNKDGMAN